MDFSKKKKQKMLVAIVLAVLIFVVSLLGVFSYFYSNRCYDKYTVHSKVNRSDSNNVFYEYYKGNILKYSRSGISEIDNEGKTLWNGGYEMKNPQVDTCGDFVVVADVDGKEFFVFNGKDEGTCIETSLPIVRAKVARQGVVAVLLKDKDSNVLNLYNPYDPAQRLLVEIPTNVLEEGYPLDFDISPDGKSIVTSHLIISGGGIENKVSFYNFTEVGQDKNTLVGGKSFGDEMIARIEFVEDDKVVVFRERGYTVFEKMRKPELVLEKNFDVGIKSVAFSSKYIVVVTAKDGKVDNQILSLFDMKGKQKLEQKISYEYDDMKLHDEEIVFVGNRSCDILRLNGHDKFHYKFEEEIDGVFPTKSGKEYTLIDTSTIQRISLNK